MNAIIKQYQSNQNIQALNPTEIRMPQDNSATHLANALGAVGETFENFQDHIDTADAKNADASLSEQFRELLYGDENGYMHSQGGAAISSHSDVNAQLKKLYDKAGEGLNPQAKFKAQSALKQRYEGALKSIDGHIVSQRKTYLNSASEARIQTQIQDAIYNPDNALQSLKTTTQEIRDTAARNGWPPEKTQLAVQQASTSIHSGIIERLESASPEMAFEYLAKNKGSMSGDVVSKLEGLLVPKIKASNGRKMGASAAGGLGAEVMQVASDTLGMNETDQRDVLAQYLKDGGKSLDPKKTAWCAAYVNATLAKAGASGTGALNARSFLEWGQKVDEPQKGDVVVLSRGDPNGWEGHVGFYDGTNEDGSIRILGGNQGGEANGGGGVSLSNYDASKVLGFRRASKDANVGGGLASLIEIEDPIERKAAISEYNLRIGVADKEAEAMRAGAQDKAFQLIEAGGNVDDLPVGVRQSLGEDAMSSLRTYQNKKASGTSVATDSDYYLKLMNLSDSDPEAFKSADPSVWRDKLDDADWEMFVKKRSDMRSGVKSTGPKISAIRTASSRALSAAGLSAKDDPEIYNAFEGDLLRWATENNANPIEIDDRINQMLVPIVLDPRGLGNKQKGSAFQIDYDGSPLTNDDDLVPSDIMDGSLSINKITVENEQIERFASEFAQRNNGNAPSVQEVVEGLIAMGIFE